MEILKSHKPYVGCWYPGQCNPQPVELIIDGRTDEVSFAYWPEISAGCYAAAFNGYRTVFTFPAEIVTAEEFEEFVEENRDLIELLLASYSERYDGQNYRGQWDSSLVDELTRQMNDFTPSLWFDEETREVVEVNP